MKIRPWAIGVFIIVGLGLLAAILFQIGSRQKAFSKHLELYTEFADLGGLGKGAKVRVSGLDAGQITKVEIPKEPSDKFRLELQVEEKVHGIIRKDSIASIETEGVVGDNFVSIKKGSEQAERVQAGATLPSKEPFTLTAVMENGSLLLNDVHNTVKDLQGRLDHALDSITRTVDHADNLVNRVQPDIYHIARSGSQITAKIDTLLTDLNAGKGPAGLLLKDEATKRQLQSTLANIQRTSANLDEVVTRADQTMADFQSRQLIAKMEASLNNVQSLSRELDETMKKALSEDNIGRDGATNLRETFSNLTRSTTNLADDTEALKHNFFFRGFFKKRGFYNLDQLTRSEYVEACARQKTPGTRRWLEASSLLADDGHGQEKLTESGRQLIDSQIAPVVDSMPEGVVVVEGYSSAGSPTEQYYRSRGRADLVRRYLESHYHLRHSDVGIVPLRDEPPKGAGRDRWDGAAIMLLLPKSQR
jgi:phospholipid/cholesterol/gamma-HCH transport system substrate-binding protein